MLTKQTKRNTDQAKQLSYNMSTVDISNAVAYLKRSTIKEILDEVGLAVGEEKAMSMNKLDLVKLYEETAVKMRIEVFVHHLQGTVVLEHIAQFLGVPCSEDSIITRINSTTISSLLTRASDSITTV